MYVVKVAYTYEWVVDSTWDTIDEASDRIAELVNSGYSEDRIMAEAAWNAYLQANGSSSVLTVSA